MNTTQTTTSTKEKEQVVNNAQENVIDNDRSGKKRFNVINYYRALIHVSTLK